MALSKRQSREFQKHRVPFAVFHRAESVAFLMPAISRPIGNVPAGIRAARLPVTGLFERLPASPTNRVKVAFRRHGRIVAWRRNGSITPVARFNGKERLKSAGNFEGGLWGLLRYGL